MVSEDSRVLGAFQESKERLQGRFRGSHGAYGLSEVRGVSGDSRRSQGGAFFGNAN